MSNTLRAITFSVVVADPEHWPDGAREIAVSEPGQSSYDDWVIGPLVERMLQAGRAHMAEFPDLFAGELT